MAEKSDGKSNDAVDMDTYNKVVQAHNSLKVEMENMQKEFKLSKEKEEQSKKNSAEQSEWKQLSVDLKNQMEELKKQVLEKSEKVSKGVVPGTAPEGQKKSLSREELKKQLDEVIPTSHIKDTSNLNPIQRYGYYKAPTQGVSSQLLGRALSLHAGAIGVGHTERSNWDRKTQDDIVVYDGQKNFG